MPVLDHVALVVTALEPVIARCRELGLALGPVEHFAEEGTREIYIGEPGRPARLLLIQPTGPEGPYARALAKRGPGLHHVALQVPMIDAASLQTMLPGWLLHPASLDTVPQSRTAWLVRPGVSVLVEMQQGTPSYAGAPLVEAVHVPVSPGLEGFLQWGESVGVHPGPAKLRLADRDAPVASFVGRGAAR